MSRFFEIEDREHLRDKYSDTFEQERISKVIAEEKSKKQFGGMLKKFNRVEVENKKSLFPFQTSMSVASKTIAFDLLPVKAMETPSVTLHYFDKRGNWFQRTWWKFKDFFTSKLTRFILRKRIEKKFNEFYDFYPYD